MGEVWVSGFSVRLGRVSMCVFVREGEVGMD